MTNVIQLRPARRPRRPHRPRPTARPALVPVSVEWDQGRGLYVAACARCCESATLHHLTDADDWADTHHCDPELVALLAAVLNGTAA